MTSLVCASVYLTVWCDSFTIPPQTERERDISYPRICQPRAEDTRKTVLLASLLGWEERGEKEASGALLVFFAVSFELHETHSFPRTFVQRLCRGSIF